MFDEVAACARESVTQGPLPCALVAVATSKEWLGIRAYDEEGRESPALHDQRFALASISKAIAGVGIACLVDRHVLDYAAPVAEYLSEFGTNEWRRRITVGDIFTHTTGFPNKAVQLIRQTGLSSADCRHLLLTDELLFQPGTRMLYNTYTYQLLNWIVERLLSKTMTEFLLEYVYEPCGMTDTSFRPLPADRTVPTVDHPVTDPEGMESYCRLEMSGSGLWSTAADLVQLGQALLTPGKLMRPETFRRVTAAQPGTPRWDDEVPSCRTWAWVKEEQTAFPRQPDTGFYHGGATGTLIWIDPDKDLVFVFLSNKWGAGNDDAFAALNTLYSIM